MAPITADASLGSLTEHDTEVQLPRATRVKNKTPAAVQITAAHILREARHGRQVRPPKQKKTDVHELVDHRLKKELISGGDPGDVTTKKALWIVKGKRPLPATDDGSSVAYEKHADYVEAARAPNFKILEASYNKWKKQKLDGKHDE